MPDLNQQVTLLYNSASVGLSAERTNLAGPLVLNALKAWTHKDKLNKINEFVVQVIKADVDRSKIFLERDVYVPGFDFRGIITGLNDIDDSVLQIEMREEAWHLTRRLYKIGDSLKEYNLTLAAPEDFADFINLVITNANTDMPFTWTLGEGFNVIDNLVSLWRLDGDGLDGKGSNDGTVTGTTPTYGADNKYGLDGLIFNGTDTKVDCGNDATLDEIFASGGSVSIVANVTSDGEADAGRLFDKSIWHLSVQGESSGLVKLVFHHSFDGDDGTWETDVDIPIGTELTITVRYDNSAVGNDPIIIVNGVEYAIAKANLTETSTPTGTADLDTASDLIIGNDTTGAFTFDGLLQDGRVYSDIVPLLEHNIIRLSAHSYLDNWRTDEIPWNAIFDFDVKWKHFYETLRLIAINTSNDLWFEGHKIWIGTKGKSVTLEREDKIYEKLSTKIDLDTYGNIINVVGAESGGTNLHATETNAVTDTLYDYERVISNNNLKTQDAVDGVTTRLLGDIDSIAPDVKLDVTQDTINKYGLESGDIIKINSNTETQTVKGFYRIIEVILSSGKNSLKLQFSKDGKFLPRISDSLDILEATLLKLQDIELNS